MKCRTALTLFGTALCGFLLTAQSARAQASAFTYQGRLTDTNGQPVTGSFTFQFKLRPAPATNIQVGATLTNNAVPVASGLFVVNLDFGANVFDGSARWLEIGVRTNGSTNAFDILSPTQPLTATPYAIRAALASAFLGGIVDSQLSLNIPRLDSASHFTGAVIFDDATGGFSGAFNGAATGTFSGTASGTFSGGATLTGSFSGTNSGLFFGDGAGITNINVTNIVGIVQSNPNWQLVQTTLQQAVVANNYLVTNNAPTTLILPASPPVGATLRIAGAGAAGWALAQNSNQSILTGTLGLPGGRAWTPHAIGPAPGTNVPWTGIASSADGLKLVAVPGGSSPVYVSADGGNSWTNRNTNAAWVAVASSTDGTRLAAASGSQQISTSTNSGLTWTNRGPSHAWTAIASSADGIKLVATEGSGLIYTSTDSGATWTSHASALAWIGVASSADGVKLAAAVNVGNIFTSTDSGSNWTARATTLGNLAWSGITSSSDGTKLAASVNGGGLYTSGDSGVTWTLRPALTNVAWKTISSSGNGVNLVAAINGVALYTSFDSGQTWTLRLANAIPWSASAFSTDGTRVAASVNGGQIYTSISATTVGTGFIIGNQYSSLEVQYIGGGLWMPLSSFGSFIGN